MKKILASLCLSILLISSGYVLAADALYRMLYADEVESFRKDQDAMIIGQLIDRHGNNFSVQVLKVLSGEVNSDTILVSDDFYYGWGQVTPKTNDFCVMSLKKTEGIYHKAWGIFKADGGDYKTLKLVPDNAESPGLSADLACIEWYVNSGGKERDFFFKSGTAYVKRPNGETIQLYPKATTNSETRVTSGSQQPNEGTTRPDTERLKDFWFYFSTFALVILWCLALVVKNRFIVNLENRFGRVKSYLIAGLSFLFISFITGLYLKFFGLF